MLLINLNNLIHFIDFNDWDYIYFNLFAPSRVEQNGILEVKILKGWHVQHFCLIHNRNRQHTTYSPVWSDTRYCSVFGEKETPWSKVYFPHTKQRKILCRLPNYWYGWNASVDLVKGCRCLELIPQQW